MSELCSKCSDKINSDKYEIIEIDIPDDLFLQIAKEAHENDITFNQRVNEILVEQMDKIEKAV